MADAGIKFDFKPLQQYTERLEQLDKFAKNLDKTLDGLQTRQGVLDKRFVDGARTTQRMVEAFNKHDRAAIAALRSSEKLDEVFSKAPTSVKRFEDSLKRTKQALEDVKAAGDKVDASQITDNFEKAGTKSAEGFGKSFKSVFEKLNASGIARNFGTKLQDGFKTVLPDVLRRSGDILVKGFTGIAQQVGRSFMSGLQGLGNAAVGFFQGVKNNISGIFQGLGQTLSVIGLAGGLSAGAIAGGAFNTLVEFDRAIINTQAATQQTNEEIAILREQLLEIGGTSRVGVEATANAFYDVASAVSDVNLQIPILESSILLAESGSDPVNELATATDGLVNVFNAYGLTADQATRVSDTFARSVQLGKGSLTEFVDAISSVAVVGANANVSFEELGASIAFITARGASASEAATQLERATSALLRPNADLQVLLNQIGFESGSAALEALGLAGTLQALFEATGGNVDQFAQALGSVEAFQAGLALADESYNEFQANFNEGLDGATLRSAEIQANSIAARLDQLNAAFGRVQVILADTLLPIILPIVEGFTDFFQTIAQNNPELIQFATILGLVAISLPVIATAFGLILNPVGLLVAAVITLSSAFADVSNSIPLLQEAAALVQDIGSALGFSGEVVVTDTATVSQNQGGTGNTEAAIQQEQRLLGVTYRRLGAEQEIAELRTDSAQQTLDYTIEAGDTLSEIALEYGVSIEDLLAANPQIEDPSLIIAGQTLTIPTELSLELDSTNVEETISEAQSNVLSMFSTGSGSDAFTLVIEEHQAAQEEIRIRNIREAIEELKTSVLGIIDSTRLELGEGFDTLVTGLQAIAAGDVSGGLVLVKDALADIVGTVLDAGKDFGFAIIDFLGEVLGIDTKAAKTALAAFFDPITNFIDGVQSATTSEFERIGRGIETILDAADALGEGDIGTALSGLGQGITDITSGLAGATFETADQFLIFLEDVTGIDTSTLRDTVDNIRSIVDGVVASISSFADPVLKAAGESLENDILPALGSLGTGLNTFLDQVGDLLESDSAQTVSRFLGQLFGITLVFVGSVASSVFESLGENLPILGQGITDIVDAMALFIEGDTEGGFESLATGLGNIRNAILGFTADTTIGILQAFEDITGIDTSGLQRTVRSIELILKDPLLAVRQLIHQLGEEIERFVIDLQIKIAEAILGIPGIDQILSPEALANLESNLAVLQNIQFDIDAAEGIERAINGAIMEDGVISLEDLGPTIQLELQNANVVAHIDPATRANIRDATQDALVAGTAEDALNNLLVSSAIGIDISDQNFIISDERKAELQTLVTSEIESILAIAPEDLTTADLIRLDELINVSDELNLELGEGLTTAVEQLDATLAAEVEAVAAGGDSAFQQSVLDLVAVGNIDFSQSIADMQATGSDVAEGFSAGINSGTTDVETAATDMGQAAIDASKATVGAQSPATEFIAIGGNITEGLAIGIQQGFPAVQAALALLRNEMRALGQDGVNNVNNLTNAYMRFAGVVGASSTRIIQALNAVTEALINFGTAAAGLALSVSVAENALAGAGSGVGPQHTGGIVALETGGIVQTLSAPGASESQLYKTGSAMAAVDRGAAWALTGERGRELATYDLSLFGLNNNLTKAYDFGYQQAINPTAQMSVVGTNGPQLVRTTRSLAILNNQTTEAYFKGYQMAQMGLQGYRHGGIVHAEIPRLAGGGLMSPGSFAALSGNGGTIINEDNHIELTFIIEGSNADVDELADTMTERAEEVISNQNRKKKSRFGRLL